MMKADAISPPGVCPDEHPLPSYVKHGYTALLLSLLELA